jgi:hypothetical protein
VHCRWKGYEGWESFCKLEKRYDKSLACLVKNVASDVFWWCVINPELIRDTYHFLNLDRPMRVKNRSWPGCWLSWLLLEVALSETRTQMTCLCGTEVPTSTLDLAIWASKVGLLTKIKWTEMGKCPLTLFTLLDRRECRAIRRLMKHKSYVNTVAVCIGIRKVVCNSPVLKQKLQLPPPLEAAMRPWRPGQPKCAMFGQAHRIKPLLLRGRPQVQPPLSWALWYHRNET